MDPPQAAPPLTEHEPEHLWACWHPVGVAADLGFAAAFENSLDAVSDRLDHAFLRTSVGEMGAMSRPQKGEAH